MGRLVKFITMPFVEVEVVWAHCPINLNQLWQD